MNFSAFYLLAGALLLVAIALAANSSAACVLRNKEIPPPAAQTIRRIVFAAFFALYLVAAISLAVAALAPQTGELISALLFQPSGSASMPSAALLNVEVPHGRIAAEQSRPERRRMIEQIEELQSKAAAERRQLFGPEQSYVLTEGISGTEDRYRPPKPDGAQAVAPDETPPAQTRISVQGVVATSGNISSILAENQPPPVQEQNAPQPPAPVQQQQPDLPAPVQMAPQRPLDTLADIRSSIPPPAAPLQAVTPPLPPPAQPVQQQPAAQNVSCREIKMYMDSADEQIFRRAMRQETGVATPWKGPGGSYVAIPSSIKGNCREYSLQATIQGIALRCYAACASLASPAPPASSAMPQPRNDKTAILSSMSGTDHDALLKALHYHGPVSWRGMNGIFYTVAPLRLGNPCREYTVQANIQGRIFQYVETNCQ